MWLYAEWVNTTKVLVTVGAILLMTIQIVVNLNVF